MFRGLGAGDRDALAELFHGAFLSSDNLADRTARMAIQLEDSRQLGVFDGERLVGSGSVIERRLTLPERTVVPLAAVTFVAVATDHRRRGILRQIMRTQLREIHEAGGPAVAALWASEAAIYQRFGYGPATFHINYSISAKASFRSGVDLGGDRVRELSVDEALPRAKALYETYAANRAGALGRGDRDWRDFVFDPEGLRNGRSRQRWAVHPQGYAAYRVKPHYGERGFAGEVQVEELIATTPQAHAALLRYLLDIDLAGEVQYWAAVDDPLPLLLDDSRAAIAKTGDGLYVRLVDVDRALAQRRYSGPVDVVVEVADEHCPWNAGRVRLTVDEKGVPTVTRTGDPADLATGSTELGAAYLGGTRLTRLADAGRVTEHTPGAVAALSAALLSDREPRALEVF